MNKQYYKFFILVLLTTTFFSYIAKAYAANAQVISVSPSSGSGLSQTFVFTYSDPQGVSDLTDAAFLFSPTGTTANNCWVDYSIANNYFGLASDDTTTWSYSTPGSSGQLQNSQCSINEAGFTVNSSGNTLTLTVPVTFQVSAQTVKDIYLRAIDKEGGTANFTPLGSWTVQAAVTTQPTTVSSNVNSTASMQTGMYFAPPSQWQALKNAGYNYVVTTVDADQPSQWPAVFNAAQAAGIQLIIGASSGGAPAYSDNNGVWSVTSDGVSMLNYFAAHASLIKAVFVYNEPYYYNQFTGLSSECGGTSAADLRSLRTAIQNVWPGAKIYQDIGAPSQWAPGGALASQYPCIGNKFADQTDVADYVGVWYYPFTASGYNKTAALDDLTVEDNFVINSMSPAVPINLAQGFAQGQSSVVMPTLSQITDWNCSLRLLPAAGISWYVWTETPLYSDYLSNYPSYWQAVGTGKSCATSSAPSIPVSPAPVVSSGSGSSTSTTPSTGGGSSGNAIFVSPSLGTSGVGTSNGGGTAVNSNPAATSSSNAGQAVTSSGSGMVNSTPAATASTALSLVNNNGTYYLIQNGMLSGITSPGILFSYGLNLSDAKTATPNDLALPKSNLLLPDNGALVKSKQDPTVYLISDNQRHAFVSATVFMALGFKFSSVLLVTNPGLQALPIGAEITNGISTHLDGVDINDNGTIYWISGATRQSYPSLAVYNSWHLTNDFSTVVPANAADLNLPIGEQVKARVIN